MFDKLRKSLKGGVFEDIGALGVGIAGLAIVLVVVFVMLSQLRTNATVTADNNATVAVNSLTNAASGLPNWVPLVVIAVIGAILIGLVAMFRGSNQ